MVYFYLFLSLYVLFSNNVRIFIMKNMIAKSVLSGLMTSLLFACNEKKEEQPASTIDKDLIKREIQAKEDSFAAVYNSGQVRNIGYYADDAISFFQNRPPLIGRDSIVSFLKNDIHSNADEISFKTNEVFVSNDGNLVVEIGAFLVIDSLDVPINRGNYMSVFEKRNGKYVAVRDMSASDGSIAR
jgi:ketosteroid isomerase-like protein